MTRLPTSFDRVADLYDTARPSYPTPLLADLTASARLSPASRVLEIGCGTGQLTRPLARTGAHLDALEPGPHLAARAREHLHDHPAAAVVESRFEDYELPTAPYDLVVSATAFHWVDPVVRVPKAAAALRPGAFLAVVDTYWGIGDEVDDFFWASQGCYDRWDPEYDPAFVLPTTAELPSSRPDLEASGAFVDVELRQYGRWRSYSAQDYCDLLATFSNILGLPEDHRRQFLSEIRSLIDDAFGGSVRRHDLFRLWLARKDAG